MSWVVTSNEYTNSSWGSGSRIMRLTINERVDQSRNCSYLDWTCSCEGYDSHYVTTQATTIKINGTTVYQREYTPYTNHVFPAAVGSVSGTTTVVHNANGIKTNVPIEFSTRVGQSDYGATDWAVQSGHISSNITISDNHGRINLTPVTVYSLTLSEGDNTTITAERTSSGYTNATLGVLSSGATLYTGDTLLVSFAADAGYQLTTHQVNGADYSSGNTLTVSGNVNIVSSAGRSVSSVGATDAEIGSVSSITVTKYNSMYYHSLEYSFGNLSGYITSNGGTSSNEIRIRQTNIAFTLPATFYTQIPNDLSGVCTITCHTYPGLVGNEIGEPTSCTITAYVNANNAAPIVHFVSVTHPTDSQPYTLTGSESRLIRYKSNVTAVVSLAARYGSSIVSCSINGVPATISNDSASVTFTESEALQYIAQVVDSRGLISTVNAESDLSNLSVVRYIRLTCNPTFRREAPSSNKILLSFTGSMFRGNFGNYVNSLQLRYRYREKGTTNWSVWTEIPAANISYGTNSYYSATAIDLTASGLLSPSGGFDYQKAWELCLQARDGITGARGELSAVPEDPTVNGVITVQKGFPIFDWGENDFNINGDLKLFNVNIFDLIYPVGTIYRSALNQLPSSISDMGNWTSLTVGTADAYEWRRTS